MSELLTAEEINTIRERMNSIYDEGKERDYNNMLDVELLKAQLTKCQLHEAKSVQSAQKELVERIKGLLKVDIQMLDKGTLHLYMTGTEWQNLKQEVLGK
jgi:hypothetical protein